MQKKIIRSPLVPETGGPFNLAVSYDGMIYISGLPPFEEAFCTELREARRLGKPLPKMPDLDMDTQVHIVMKHLKALLEAGGSNMDCLLKVVVWLKDQSQMGSFDKIYRSYFSSDEALPTRTRIQAGRTPFDCALEIDAIGFIPKAS
ncbi:RidA family protein [Pusillimonas sp. SM2304]|uniref:RidA family protein n=1 Tax=Pusillimonas sp. SM2304 TaxID=3073241 RepID=UPI0028770A50|nr:RidA family protein [Pusillimonas sp. SM2304]MDS1140579.1 RidA family protein [Pusillimonas sp. SM2304]